MMPIIFPLKVSICISFLRFRLNCECRVDISRHAQSALFLSRKNYEKALKFGKEERFSDYVQKVERSEEIFSARR
ncbi:unnamed protein product [Cylicocyclus nassatus]|uniref:Uncharacterized protein n=1 Tax=Cylicocyclus nassatus TaxID=53992 RepID=A0AA36GTB0_CYLNA|nr:unnamed protein product [Cylicocyclus nassatus]